MDELLLSLICRDRGIVNNKRVASCAATTYTVFVGKLLLLFTIVPLCELYLLLLIDEQIGLWPTIAIVLTTGFIGALLARSEGLRVLRQWQRSLVRGKVPEEGVLGGVLILVGGVLLVTPGVMTDLVGLLLMFPVTRRRVADAIRRRLERRIQDGSIRVVNISTVDTDAAPDQRTGDFRPRNVVMDVMSEPIGLEDDEDDDDADESADRRVLH